jgi:hypothetical protein
MRGMSCAESKAEEIELEVCARVVSIFKIESMFLSSSTNTA